MKFLPPCKKDGVLCDKRTIMCHSTCKEYIEWEKKHAIEREENYKKRLARSEADTFLSKQGERANKAYHQRYTQEKNGG